ncbi:glycosyltransferase family 2 protein [Croceimicrobium hydrocarbonivorans]|uniref:Glycosyltransferase family 2 protein n=1 Tax=Croceimicrobium hydrocarbonivorans TaxID=2761580 RepID=A0A7H0VE58_9FLAO|nr:glycosyltransferase family 2 protein [Croceimicrobium hydrocarbonivorans]QNR24006.1 glycosyltransferase family 2 protein [Croceimicrobium hydrocarbonivorans]
MDLSLVIPLFNEDESLKELYSWICRVGESEKLDFEIIFVNDGSTDKSLEVIHELAAKDKRVRLISFRRNHGKSAGLNVGFAAASGDVVITMDADLQDSPDEIPGLMKMIREEGFDLVSGWKKKRYDPISKTIPTKFYNWATRRISKIHLHDFNCGLKAYRNEVVKAVNVQGEMHRYIPVLAKNAGFTKIGEKVVQHQARKYGTTKFGLSRFINGPLDLLTLAFVSKFSKRPMHFFGLYGTLMMIFGFLAALFIGVEKLVALQMGEKARLVTENPFFYLALATMVIGVQLFLAGFLAELVIRNSNKPVEYTIEERINFES